MARTRFFQGQGHYSKVKGQIKVKQWWGTTAPPNQCSYQIWTSYTLRFPRYGPDKIFKVKVTTARSRVKSRSNYDEAQLHFLTNVPTKYELPTPYSFWDMARTRFFKVKVIMARSKVKSRSNYDEAQLYFLTNVPAKYELPTPYGFRDMARTRFLRSRSLRQGQR